MKKLLFLLMVALPIMGFPQSVSFMERHVIEVESSSIIRASAYLDNHLYITGLERRSGGDIDVLLIKTNLEGKIINRSVKTNADALERGSDILAIDENNIWILCNSFSSGINTVKLLQYNAELLLIKEVILDYPSLSSGNKINHFNQVIAVAAMHRRNSLENFPVAILYNMDDENQSAINLDYNTPTIQEEITSNILYIDAKGNPATPTEKELQEMHKEQAIQSKDFNKNINHINMSEQGILVSGSENTRNYFDFWAAYVTIDGTSIWEHVYEKKNDPGADVLIRAYKKNDRFFLFGTHYNKKDNLNYNINYLVVDDHGTEINNRDYDTGFDEHLVDVLELKSGFLLLGHVDMEPDKSVPGTSMISVGDRIIDTDVVILGVDDLGNMTFAYEHKEKGFQKGISILHVRDNKYVIIGRENIANQESYFIHHIVTN